MTPRIYHRGKLGPGDEIDLSTQASHHLAKVLRARVQDTVILFNGDGFNYAATLQGVNNRCCTARITAATPCDNESPLTTTLLQGISRNDRMDTSLQKATELGVDTVIPVICRHSSFRLDESRMQKKHLHWQQVILSACEQSGRCRVPRLHQALELSDALRAVEADSVRLVLDPGAQTGLHAVARHSDHICLLTGPESGLDDNELAAAVAAGYCAVRMGPRVLRTETAGPAALTAIQALWGDLGS